MLITLDTDSLYFSISGETLRDITKPEMKEDFDRQLVGRECCSDLYEPKWLPRECCTKHNKFDNRTPGKRNQ